MMLILLLFVPVIAGIVMFIPGSWPRRPLLPAVALVHTLLSAMTLNAVRTGKAPSALGGMLQPDALGVLFLMLASLLFLAASFYAIGYLREEELDLVTICDTPEEVVRAIRSRVIL